MNHVPRKRNISGSFAYLMIQDKHPHRPEHWKQNAARKAEGAIESAINEICDDYDARLENPIECIRHALDDWWDGEGWIVEDLHNRRIAYTSYGDLYRDVKEFGFTVKPSDEGLMIYDRDQLIGFADPNHADYHDV